jgi:hypothetical protein
MSLTERFIQALQQLETARDPESLVTLFAPEAELHSLASETPARDPAQTREFWQRYRSAFNAIQSRFTQRLETENFSVLEWIADGELRNGMAIKYRGISILEWDHDQITNFRTYYDSAAFLPVTPKTKALPNEAEESRH